MLQIHTLDPLSPKGDQHQFSPTKINIQSKDRSRELFNDHQREIALIFRQILATNSVSKMSGDQCGEFVCGSLDIFIFKVENLPRGLNNYQMKHTFLLRLKD